VNKKVKSKGEEPLAFLRNAVYPELYESLAVVIKLM
jgi:hypothetical protein